ncbi:MAG: hypothetical protein OQK24_00670 [Magnetovibrio sp.]|nr:hypothetical protein [Magnetovibrio sp.]
MTGREAAMAISGALRLARFDLKGAFFFNATVKGFWNSFWVAAILAPLHLLEIMLVWQEEPATTQALRFFSVEAIMYVMGWTAFPLAMVYVCNWIDRSNRFLRFGIANNWTDLIVSAVFIPVQLAITLDLLTGTLMSALLAAVIVYAMALAWFIARYTLNLSGLAAAGVVILAVFINWIVRGFGETLIYAI